MIHYYNENTGQVVDRDAPDPELDERPNFRQVSDPDEARTWGPTVADGVLARPDGNVETRPEDVPDPEQRAAAEQAETQRLADERKLAEQKAAADPNTGDPTAPEQRAAEKARADQATSEEVAAAGNRAAERAADKPDVTAGEVAGAQRTAERKAARRG